MMPDKMQDSAFPAGNSVAGGMADLHQRRISKFSCYRDSLFDEAEESLLHRSTSSASSQSVWRLTSTRSVDSIEPFQSSSEHEASLGPHILVHRSQTNVNNA
jgi:hypothetical protein